MGAQEHVLEEGLARPGVEPERRGLAAELRSSGRRPPGGGRCSERRVALGDCRLVLVLVVCVAALGAAVLGVVIAKEPAPCEVARDAAHGVLESRADLARRQVGQSVKDDVLPFLAIDAREHMFGDDDEHGAPVLVLHRNGGVPRP